MAEYPLGIMVKMLSGNEVEGTILVRNLNDVNFLFCNHPLYPRKVDEDYVEEYQAAGLFSRCALFSYEDMEKGKLTLYGNTINGLTIYRGWIMKPEMYREFYKELEKREIYLINTPDEYERYHLLPGWYGDFKDDTVESTWTNGSSIEEVL